MSILKVRGTDGLMHEILALRGEAGKTPVKGLDYFTESDKSALIDELLTALNSMTLLGTVNEDKSITITSSLADGVYSIRYENADGSTTEIGTITVGDNNPSYVNLFDPDTATLNQRWSNSSYAYKAGNGYVVSDYIPATSGQILRFRGAEFAGNACVLHYNSSKAPIAASDASTVHAGCGPDQAALTQDENGDSCYTVGTKNGVVDSRWASGVAYIRVTLQVNAASAAITKDDIQNIIMTIDEVIAD